MTLYHRVVTKPVIGVFDLAANVSEGNPPILHSVEAKLTHNKAFGTPRPYSTILHEIA